MFFFWMLMFLSPYGTRAMKSLYLFGVHASPVGSHALDHQHRNYNRKQRLEFLFQTIKLEDVYCRDNRVYLNLSVIFAYPPRMITWSEHFIRIEFCPKTKFAGNKNGWPFFQHYLGTINKNVSVINVQCNNIYW